MADVLVIPPKWAVRMRDARANQLSARPLALGDEKHDCYAVRSIVVEPGKDYIVRVSKSTGKVVSCPCKAWRLGGHVCRHAGCVAWKLLVFRFGRRMAERSLAAALEKIERPNLEAQTMEATA